ncbi:MAG: hypothetical protein LC725_00590 [Lentisphaerae bacterium]|nr:hypothetical protein [Lentisphaerota bacterium]
MMRFDVGHICVVCILLMLCSIPALAGEFALNVNDVSGLDEPWPLVGGLPFPEGELRDAAQISIVDGDGREVPAQIDVAATWRDGSIRWALAGFTASPQGDYRVAYGPGVSRTEPASPLTVQADEAGNVTVDTGAAVYKFVEGRLLPESGRMGDTVFLADSGDGAYLVDNKGRLSRVAGERSEIETEIVKQGPCRTVIYRTGWYVTDDGERVAKAKVWFYFAVDSPYVSVTHTLVLTENTNEWWIRDYGLQFNTPEPAAEVTFALSNPAPFEEASHDEVSKAIRERQDKDLGLEDFSLMFSGMRGREWRTFQVKPGGDEVFMLQETYPHFFEREFRAVIGRIPAASAGLGEIEEINLGQHLNKFEKQMQVAGDWADGRYSDYGLTVVMPWLAQRFPKEIAFGPEGTRVAFWSGRSGRSLDFRPATLVKEYWKRWAMAHEAGAAFSQEGAEKLAGIKTGSKAASPEAAPNAEGAARTHEAWLLPHGNDADAESIKARATAAARPPLVMADPQWLTSTEAIGWPLHPKDTERFPKVEKVISDYWDGLFASNNNLSPTGFIEWGRQPPFGGHNKHRRLGKIEDYYLRQNSWQLYARSGERHYYEYALRFNRFSGDYSVSHSTGGDGKIKGAYMYQYRSSPIWWGYDHKMWARNVAGQSVKHWLIGHYLTGDEYSFHIADMMGNAYKEHWDGEVHGVEELGAFTTMGRLTDLYTMRWDEQFRKMAEAYFKSLIDLDNPTGRSEISQNGVFYKQHRDMYNMYMYYRWTGDERAKKALLKGLDYQYRFNRISPAFSKNWSDLLYSEAYRWTGRPEYLRVVKHLADEARQGTSRPWILGNWHILGSVPSGLSLLAEVNEDEIGPYPLLETDEPRPIIFTKRANDPVTMSIFVRMSSEVPEDAETIVRISPQEDENQAVKNVRVNVESMFPTKYDGRRDLRRRHVNLTIPAEAPAGQYTVRIPDTSHIVVLESNALKIDWLGSEPEK